LASGQDFLDFCKNILEKNKLLLKMVSFLKKSFFSKKNLATFLEIKSSSLFFTLLFSDAFS
jgi:hypothetical protein